MPPSKYTIVKGRRQSKRGLRMCLVVYVLSFMKAVGLAQFGTGGDAKISKGVGSSHVGRGVEAEGPKKLTVYI